jgi:uncharacterized membrane protein
MKLHIAILLLAAGVFASCKSSSTSPSTNNNNNTTNKTVILTVGSTTDTLAIASITSYGPATTVLTTPHGLVVDNFTLLNISSNGKYNIGSTPGASSIGVLMNYTDSSGATYSSSTAAGTPNGSMTIAGISSTTLQASFFDTLYLISGNANSPQTVVITNGSINGQ